MNEEINTDVEVILEIENKSIRCLKHDLIQHSDYFKAMFEGSFIEKDKKVIKLEGIDYKAMNIILALLWDRTFLINEEDIISVLQVSCMLQFIEIKAMCLAKLTELLLPRNCFKIWLIAEQLDLRPLYLKAKSMTLIEFDVIKDLDNIADMQLKQLCCYLGNISLQCRNEMDVFQMSMKWWYENEQKFFKTDTGDILLNFLSCLDFKNLLNSDIHEIMTYPDISSNMEILKLLQCVLDLRLNLNDTHEDQIVTIARKLCKSKSRICMQYPCILVNACSEEQARKKLKTSSLDVYCDAFMRKRYYKNINGCESSISIIYYDSKRESFSKLLDIDKEKCVNLDGFKVIGYKEFIFLFGGEYLMGKGNWNKNFWVFDMVRESWERKSILPFVRRHFESCICGNYLYIVGGTGNFRVVQYNMFWYNFKEDKWSGQIELPCVDRQLKCCCWNNRLFLLSTTSKSGYVFDQEKSLWYKLNIPPSDSETICSLSDNCTVFAYKSHLYIKGKYLIQLELKEQSLGIGWYKQLQFFNHDQVESVICGDVVYSLYKQTLLEKGISTLTFEKFYMKSLSEEIVFRDVLEGSEFDLHGQPYTYKMLTTIFGFQHYNLVENDDFVNQL